MNKIEFTEEAMEFILSYMKAGEEDKEKIKKTLDGDIECLKEEKSVIS